MSLILQLECKLHEGRHFSLLLIAKCAAISKVWAPGTIYWLYKIISFFRPLPLPDPLKLMRLKGDSGLH